MPVLSKITRRLSYQPTLQISSHFRHKWPLKSSLYSSLTFYKNTVKGSPHKYLLRKPLKKHLGLVLAVFIQVTNS